MRYDAFIEQVQERGDLPTREQAERVVQATLETLGERLWPHRTEQRHIKAQLPKELSDYMQRRKGAYHYPLEEFYNRVGARADLGYTDAVRLSRVVMETLQGAITPGEWQHLTSELPDEYDVLLGRETPPPTSPLA